MKRREAFAAIAAVAATSAAFGATGMDAPNSLGLIHRHLTDAALSDRPKAHLLQIKQHADAALRWLRADNAAAEPISPTAVEFTASIALERATAAVVEAVMKRPGWRERSASNLLTVKALVQRWKAQVT